MITFMGIYSKKKDVYIPTYECMCKGYIFTCSRHVFGKVSKKLVRVVVFRKGTRWLMDEGGRET